MTTRRRLDRELVRRGIAASGEEAVRLIADGIVTVGGAPAPNPARLVGAGEALVITSVEPYVSRGGKKLDAALDRFEVDVRDLRVIDAGASTGGFTDCVLQRGAREVVAVDVGHGQMHERLRADARVAVHERTNIRETHADDLGGSAQLVVADLSFISIRTVSSHLLDLIEPGGHLVILVKPQFEADRQEASRGKGVIRDPAIWARTLRESIDQLHADGAAIMGVMPSPITGAQGNVEFLVHAVRHAVQHGPGHSSGIHADPTGQDLAAAIDIDAVVAEAAQMQG